METLQRSLTIVTSLGRRYSGKVDIPNENFRSTDLLNSANAYWRNPNEKCYDNAIMMYDVTLYVDNIVVYKRFEKIQVKMQEIIYFYDDLLNVGDAGEKKRASTMMTQIHESAQKVNIITGMVGASFYDITGTFYGLFKKKSKDRFFTLTQAEIVEIYKKENKWTRKSIHLPHQFICVNNAYVESVAFG